MKKFILAFATAVLLGTVTSAYAASPELDKVLRQLDAASANFHSAQAEFKWDTYTKVVDSTDTQTGTVYFKRAAATQMAAQIRQLNGQDEPKTFVYDGTALKIYNPRIKQITQFAAGKNKSQYESFLTLGFGGSGTDLAANWEIKFVGYETLQDGTTAVTVAHLDLVSKQESVRNMFSKVSVWVDPARDVTLKQVFIESSGDVHTDYFYDIKLNANISPKNFSLDAKSLGAQVIQR
ncbi:MAG TPA: outer membrane lipoprotein carrier protein LolA [Acidobacteriaceae bacterium]|nr:outer membrane lipoprotein carrier protein LolA [Acidobacteriaceae bacterium]